MRRRWTSPAGANDDQHHFESEVTERPREVAGCLEARLLRRDDDEVVIFTSITFVTGLEADRGFAGEDPERTVVGEAARRSLTR